MTENELKAEALNQGFRLTKIPEYDCSCYMPYPNEGHRHKNGKWKCVDNYVPLKVKSRGEHFPCTKCRRKKNVRNKNKER